jgi:hypothetical protein
MARIFFLAIVFYLLYKLVFDLIVPVYKTTRQVRQQFNDMQGTGQGHTNAARQNDPANNNGHSNRKNKAGEYIDFEEVE